MHDLSFVIRNKYIVRPYFNIAFNEWGWRIFPEEGNVIRSMYANYDRATEIGLALVQNEQLFNGVWQMNNTFSWFHTKVNGMIMKSRYVAADLDYFGEADFTSRLVGFSLSYNFGNQKVSGTRKRSVSNDDIKNRAK
jgi:hypothetical protein